MSTHEGQILDHELGIRAGESVPASGERAAPATFEGVRERFAAYAAHELRAPIAFQRALVEITLADPDADTAALRKMGERVVASCLRQQRLIDALLELARSARGLTRQEPVDISAIAAAALRAHGLGELGSVVALDRARTTGDPDLLERLVANLVSNAIRHNVVGGWIEVGTRAESGRAVLSVANTGPPIPAGELQNLFQPFRRLAVRQTDSAGGAGLGLAIVQAVADAHHAVVTARARAGGGLEIHVSFPATVDRGAAHGGAPQATRPLGRALSVGSQASKCLQK